MRSWSTLRADGWRVLGGLVGNGDGEQKSGPIALSPENARTVTWSLGSAGSTALLFMVLNLGGFGGPWGGVDTEAGRVEAARLQADTSLRIKSLEKIVAPLDAMPHMIAGLSLSVGDNSDTLDTLADKITRDHADFRATSRGFEGRTSKLDTLTSEYVALTRALDNRQRVQTRLVEKVGAQTDGLAVLLGKVSVTLDRVAELQRNVRERLQSLEYQVQAARAAAAVNAHPFALPWKPPEVHPKSQPAAPKR